MKPVKILFFLIVVLSIILLISVFSPTEELVFSENIYLKIPKNKFLKKKSSLEIFPESSTKEEILIKDTSMLIDSSMFFHKDSLKHADSLYKVDSIVNSFPKADKKATKIKGLTSLEYPNNNKKTLYSFFQTIDSCYKKNELIRILHYGDSQIEGDRVTTYIRYHLQKQFGGMGTGLFSVKLINKNYISLNLEVSDNWKRHTYYDFRTKDFPHNRLGAMLTISRFTLPNQFLQETTKTECGEIYLSKSQLTYSLNRNFEQCRIFYGYNKKPLLSEVSNKDNIIDAEILSPSTKVKELVYDLHKFPEGLKVSFKGQDSPDVYGISLDGYKGVAVDNISLRGSKGLDFSKIDLTNLKQMYDLLNVKLIIMQFGVNVVPWIKKNYDDYEHQFYKQLVLLKSLVPNMQIIVMGVSDMNRKEGEEFVSYPNIEKIRNAQKNASMKANCIFWDTYEAMGGKNSMSDWVNQSPPLGQKDYIHFSYEGSKKIAELFYEALMNDYNEFRKKNDH